MYLDGWENQYHWRDGKGKKKKKHKNHLISSTENIWQQQMQGGL